MNIPLAKIPAMVEKMLKPFSGVIVYKTKSETVKIEYNIEEKLVQKLHFYRLLIIEKDHRTF